MLLFFCIFFEGSTSSHQQTSNIILQPRVCWNVFLWAVLGDYLGKICIFEKFDRKIRNRTLGCMLGPRKRVAVTWHVWYRNCKTMQFKYGGVFLRKNAKHSFENALLVRCHFSTIPQIGLMSVARFSWVPNLYNLHFLLENHRPQPDPVKSYRDLQTIWTNPVHHLIGQQARAMITRMTKFQEHPEYQEWDINALQWSLLGKMVIRCNAYNYIRISYSLYV